MRERRKNNGIIFKPKKSFAMEGTGSDLTEKIDRLLVSVDVSIKHGNFQTASEILEEVKELLNCP